MPRGGKRPGSGRKRGPVKELHIGEATAERLLAKLKHEEQILEIYAKCGDWRLKWDVLEKLMDRAFGKPAQTVRHTGPTHGEAIRVTIEDVA